MIIEFFSISSEDFIQKLANVMTFIIVSGRIAALLQIINRKLKKTRMGLIKYAIF